MKLLSPFFYVFATTMMVLAIDADAASWARTRTDASPDENQESKARVRSSPTSSSSKSKTGRKKGTAVMAQQQQPNRDDSTMSTGEDDGDMMVPRPDIAASLFASFTKIPCHENGAVHAWCSDSVGDMDLECAIHPSTNTYACRCDADPSHCPTECIDTRTRGPATESGSEDVTSAATQPLWTTSHSIVCHHIPEDEPNFVIVQSKDVTAQLPLHHCENNALVANWCNEAMDPANDVNGHQRQQQQQEQDGNDHHHSSLDCLLLPALDEYVCTCYGNRAACPQDCVNGVEPDRVSAHAIRCKGIPQDTPNYIILEGKNGKHDESAEDEDLDDWIR